MPTNSERVDQLLKLASKIQKDSHTVKPVDGWVPFAISSDNKIMAAKDENGVHKVASFEPTGEWKEEAQMLIDQREFRRLASQLTKEEIDQWRVARGHPTMAEAAKKKKEFNPNHDELGRFTDADGVATATTSKTVPFDTALKSFEHFSAITKMPAYSYDPAIGKAYNAMDVSNAKQMLANYTDGKSDLYVIGVTNHSGQLDRESHSSYSQVENSGFPPFIGYWKSDGTGVEYTDISYPLDKGTQDTEAISRGSDNAQESVLVIRQDGTIEFLNSKVPPA